MSKRDRQGARTPADLERKYDFEKRFVLNDELDQREVFDRLTNYGKSQGIFTGDDGNIYINASYLVTGILQSQDKETFYLDLVNGILKGKFQEFSISGKSVDDIAGEMADTVQSNAEEYADKAAKDAVDAQTQTDVFNKLTNNGDAQGIFFKDGQLYINASYLIAGILKSTDAATFYLDLANNILKGNFTTLSLGGREIAWTSDGFGGYTLGQSGGSTVGKMYKGAWIATTCTKISEPYTETISLPAGTYLVSVVAPYCADLTARVCINFSAQMAIGTGATFIDASYGTVTMLATFTAQTNLRVLSAASNNIATWSYLDRGGIAAVRVG